MNKLLSFLFLLLFSHTVLSQKTIVNSFLHFSGAIDKYPIEMVLQFTQQSDSVFGSYYYTRNGKEKSIYLHGNLKNGKLDLTETVWDIKADKYIPTGIFELQFNDQAALGGLLQNDKRTKQFLINVTCQEKLSEFNPQTYRFVLNHYKGKAEVYSSEMIDYNRINQLKIYDSDNQLLQTLSGFDEATGKNGEIELEDMNFDRLLDLRIYFHLPQRIKNDHSFLYYIYDTKRRKFIRNKELEALEYLTFDAKTQEIKKWDGDGSGNEQMQYYKWLNNNFYLIREISVYENDAHTYYTEYQIKNNKSNKLKEYKK